MSLDKLYGPTFPFRGIVAVRPYPPTGLTIERWADEVAMQAVHLCDLVLTQAHVEVPALFGYTTRRDINDTYPHVVAWGDELFLEDGHNRVARFALLTNSPTMNMRVYRR